MVLHLLKSWSIEKSKLHVLCFQSSAAGSQACAAQFVQPLTPTSQSTVLALFFRWFLKVNNLRMTYQSLNSIVKIPRNPRQYCELRKSFLI
jgi:hypothetical protein